MSSNQKNNDALLEDNASTICRSVAQWFLRKDNKFYDTDRPTVALSRVDIEKIMLSRIRSRFSQIELSNELVRRVFRRAIDDLTTRDDQTIPVWNGEISCMPGKFERLIRQDGAVSINSWRTPRYRQLRINEASYGLADEFFAALMPREAEKAMFLNWLAWCLQHEDDKPMWGPLLYSRNMGTGKSTLCGLLAKRFGEDNSVTQNNIDLLTSRLNMTPLRSKLVVSEELQVRPGSKQANMLKSYLTEKVTISEMKNREAERVRQSCCFVFTTNHLPTWLEAENRRFYVIEVDHDGHAAGPKAAQFSDLIGSLHEFMNDLNAIARLNNALLARELPESFSAKTLNTQLHATDIMRRITSASEQTVLAMLEEELASRALNAIPEADIAGFVATTLKSPMSQTRHLMAELGWSKVKLKWGKVDHARSLWLRPGFYVNRGTLNGPNFESVSVAAHLEAAWPASNGEFIYRA